MTQEGNDATANSEDISGTGINRCRDFGPKGPKQIAMGRSFSEVFRPPGEKAL